MRKFACNKFSFLLHRVQVGLLVALFALGLLHPLLAEQVTATDSPLNTSLSTRISALWKEQALGLVLDRLATYPEITFWIDRRVDTQQRVDLHVRDLPLSEVLDALTNERSLGWSDLRTVLYIGPQDASQEIATLVVLAKDSLKGLPIAKKKIWTRKEAVSWPRLTEPRLLLAGWLREKGISLKHPELISHDLWPAQQSPPLSLIERVVLLLNGFDLTCQVSPDGNTCTVVPIDRPIKITRTYDAGRYSRDMVTNLEREAPELQVAREGRGLTATGRWEDHLTLQKLLSGKKPPPQDLQPNQPNSRRLFSLRLTNQPLENVISQIARQVGLELKWDRGLLAEGADLRNQLVSCDVQEVDLPTLVRSIVDPVGIDFRLEEESLFLFAPTD